MDFSYELKIDFFEKRSSIKISEKLQKNIKYYKELAVGYTHAKVQYVTIFGVFTVLARKKKKVLRHYLTCNFLEFYTRWKKIYLESYLGRHI